MKCCDHASLMEGTGTLHMFQNNASAQLCGIHRRSKGYVKALVQDALHHIHSWQCFELWMPARCSLVLSLGRNSLQAFRLLIRKPFQAAAMDAPSRTLEQVMEAV